MMSIDLPWGWILWAIAVVMATGSLAKLAIKRRDELQGKLDVYMETQLKAIHHKRKILAEHRRRVALAKKLASETAAQEAEA